MGTETLTDLQLAVMKALWAVGEGTVGEIVSTMRKDGRALATTTVATLLRRLAQQGWVAYRKHGRQLVYRAEVNEKEAAKGVLDRVLRSFFRGKVSALTAQLLESEQVSAEELRALRNLIKEKGGGP